MARKKPVDDLLTRIHNEDQWEDNINFAGVFLVDVFQGWSGPCALLEPYLRRARDELENPASLKLAAAQVDHIEALKFYKGKCTPTFIFFMHGRMRKVVRGINWPELETDIQTYTHLVQSITDASQLDSDPYEDPEKVAHEAQLRKEYEESLNQKPPPRLCSVLVITPDAAHLVEEILEDLRSEEFIILHSETLILPNDVAVNLYQDFDQMEWYEETIGNVTTGKSQVVVVSKGQTGRDTLPELADLLGPFDVEVARETQPFCLRAKYGIQGHVNGLIAPAKQHQADALIGQLVPDLEAPLAELVPVCELERTLALVRPPAVLHHGEDILRVIHEEGFHVLYLRQMTFSREEAQNFYRELEVEAFFESLLSVMTSGESLVLVLARENAVKRWRQLLGPKRQSIAFADHPECLRARFSSEDSPVNLLHGSSSTEQAEMDIAEFFPEEETLIGIKPHVFQYREFMLGKIVELGFEVRNTVEVTLSTQLAMQLYDSLADQPFYTELCAHVSSGPMCFVVLARPDAIGGFARFVGDKDPAIAKQEQPFCLRALFGEDLIKNAIYKVDSVEEFRAKVSVAFDLATLVPANMSEDKSSFDILEKEKKEMEERMQRGSAEPPGWKEKPDKDPDDDEEGNPEGLDPGRENEGQVVNSVVFGLAENGAIEPSGKAPDESHDQAERLGADMQTPAPTYFSEDPPPSYISHDTDTDQPQQQQREEKPQWSQEEIKKRFTLPDTPPSQRSNDSKGFPKRDLHIEKRDTVSDVSKSNKSEDAISLGSKKFTKVPVAKESDPQARSDSVGSKDGKGLEGEGETQTVESKRVSGASDPSNTRDSLQQSQGRPSNDEKRESSYSNALVSKTQTRPSTDKRASKTASRPSEVQRPSGVSRPSGASRPSEVQRPSGVSRPSEVQRPSGVSRPSEVQRPSGVSRPSEVQRPSGVSRPSEVQRPSGVSRPSEVPRQSGVSRPSGASRPSGVQRPSGASRPSGVSRPSVRQSRTSKQQTELQKASLDIAALDPPKESTPVTEETVTGSSVDPTVGIEQFMDGMTPEQVEEYTKERQDIDENGEDQSHQEEEEGLEDEHRYTAPIPRNSRPMNSPTYSNLDKGEFADLEDERPEEEEDTEKPVDQMSERVTQPVRDGNEIGEEGEEEEDSTSLDSNGYAKMK